MNGLSPHEAARLERFINLLLFPALHGPEQLAETNKGRARGMLASRVKWSALELAFLRSAACGGAYRRSDSARLNDLLAQAGERTA